MYVNLKNKKTKDTKFVAWCNLHKGYLTVKQLKLKRCLSKGCHHMVKIKHDWWDYRDVLKKQKKKRKKELFGL